MKIGLDEPRICLIYFLEYVLRIELSRVCVCMQVLRKSPSVPPATQPSRLPRGFELPFLKLSVRDCEVSPNPAFAESAVKWNLWLRNPHGVLGAGRTVPFPVVDPSRRVDLLSYSTRQLLLQGAAKGTHRAAKGTHSDLYLYS